MILGEVLGEILHALSTGFPDRADFLVSTIDDMPDDFRAQLGAAITENNARDAQVRSFGDALRDVGADQATVNECYRAAFYLSEAWVHLAGNPLYAYFLANRAGAVLDKWIHYFPIYTRHLERFRGAHVRVLEIGTYRGGGLDLWQNYLGPTATLIGLDNDEDAIRAVNGRYKVILGDQEDPELLTRLHRDLGPFDVVLDDGGHTMSQQKASIESLFPVLADGGVYLVEDVHTSYWPEFGGGLHADGSFIEWSKLRVDDMHARHETSIDRSSVWATHLDGLHIYDSLIVFEKRERFRPFSEVVGTSSYLFGPRFTEAVGIELLATRDVALSSRDELSLEIEQFRANVAEEQRISRAELRRATDQVAALTAELENESAELVSTRNQLLDSWEQLRDLRKTISWRVTAPLRVVRRMTSR